MKDIGKDLKKQLILEKIPKHVSDNGLQSRLYKEILDSPIKRQTNKKYKSDMNRYFNKEATWTANKHIDTQHQQSLEEATSKL